MICSTWYQATATVAQTMSKANNPQMALIVFSILKLYSNLGRAYATIRLITKRGAGISAHTAFSKFKEGHGMDAALIEILRDIPEQEIRRILDEGYTRWTYFTDSEAGEAGIIYANDTSLAMYYSAEDKTLKLGPLGVLNFDSLQYVSSSHGLYLVHGGHYSTLQVFSDTAQAGHDTTTPQEWQQFLAGHSVAKVTVPAGGQAHTGKLRRPALLIGAVALGVAALGALAYLG